MSLVTSMMLSFSLIGAVFGQCEDMAGDWYDAATEDVMKVSVVGCQLTSKYGTASVMDGTMVTPTDGILQTLELKGDYDSRMGTIKWSNGIKWIRSLTSELRERITLLEQQKNEMEQRMDGVDAIIAKLLNCTKCDTPGSSMTQPQQLQSNSTEIQELVDQMQVLNESIMNMNKTKCFTNCASQPVPTNSTDVMKLVDQIKQLNETITDVNSSKCTSCSGQSAPGTDVTQLENQIQELNATINTKCSNCTSLPQPQPQPQPQPVGNTTSTPVDVQQLVDQIQVLNETIADLNLTTGRDGYCTIEPNVTDVYVPVTRYVYKASSKGANQCTIGGPAWRGGGSTKDAASMMTRTTIEDVNCRWGPNMPREPMLAYKGDTIVFWRNGGRFPSLYEFEDEQVCVFQLLISLDEAFIRGTIKQCLHCRHLIKRKKENCFFTGL